MSKSGYTCVRHLFCWLNVLFWVSGCGVLGVGIWLRVAYEGYANLLPQYALLSTDSLAIVVGTIMFINVSGCGVLGVGIWLRIAYEGYANLLPQYALLSADSLAIVVGTIMFINVSGCGVLGVGIWLRVAYEGYANLLPQYALLSADSLVIVVGTIMFILAFFGCCGSWFQNRCMLVTYFTLVVCMFIAEFLVGSLAFVFRERLGHTLREELQDGITRHYNITARGPNSLVAIWDHLQSEFKCCGVKNYEDWFMIDAWPDQKWVPDTCCYPAVEFERAVGDHCGRTNNPDLWYSGGCSDQVQMWFLQRLHIVGIVGLVVAFTQLFGLISSMLLFCTVKHKRTSHTYKSYDMS